jgi:hypothetical protein
MLRVAIPVFTVLNAHAPAFVSPRAHHHITDAAIGTHILHICVPVASGLAHIHLSTIHLTCSPLCCNVSQAPISDCCIGVLGKSIHGATGMLHSHFSIHQPIVGHNAGSHQTIPQATFFIHCHILCSVVGFLFSLI